MSVGLCCAAAIYYNTRLHYTIHMNLSSTSRYRPFRFLLQSAWRKLEDFAYVEMPISADRLHSVVQIDSSTPFCLIC